MGARIPRTLIVIVVALKRTERRNPFFCAAKKGGKKGKPMNQNFAQLTKKIKKLEMALKKSGKKGQKCHHKDSNSGSK
jgi:hypothetical protein